MDVLAELPDEMRRLPAMKRLAQDVERKVFRIVHLIYHSQLHQGSTKDFEFSKRRGALADELRRRNSHAAASRGAIASGADCVRGRRNLRCCGEWTAMNERWQIRTAPAYDSKEKALSNQDPECRRREHALDEALGTAFLASDPVAILEPASWQEPTEAAVASGGAVREQGSALRLGQAYRLSIRNSAGGKSRTSPRNWPHGVAPQTSVVACPYVRMMVETFVAVSRFGAVKMSR